MERNPSLFFPPAQYKSGCLASGLQTPIPEEGDSPWERGARAKHSTIPSQALSCTSSSRDPARSPRESRSGPWKSLQPFTHHRQNAPIPREFNPPRELPYTPLERGQSPPPTKEVEPLPGIPPRVPHRSHLRQPRGFSAASTASLPPGAYTAPLSPRPGAGGSQQPRQPTGQGDPPPRAES